MGSGRVSREDAVALCRERGLCHVALGEPDEARCAFEDGLQIADRNAVLAEPLVAALATLDLMTGKLERAQERLSEGGQKRRASLVTQARLHLMAGRITMAEATLQACEHAPGGALELAPASALLRALTALWSGRPEQARMLYDGVRSGGALQWELIRILFLRAQWVATGDSRYLTLALGAAEELRALAADTVTPGLEAAAAAHHALLLSLSGQLSASIEPAEDALAALGTMTVPEWPQAAVLHDLAVVFRDLGMKERLEQIRSLAPRVASLAWTQRMNAVTGPRAEGALIPSGAVQGVGGGLEGQVARALLANSEAPLQGLLRGLCRATGAHGALWRGTQGQELAALGSAWGQPASAPLHALTLPSGEVIELCGARPTDVTGLDLMGLARLSEQAHALARREEMLNALHDQLAEVRAEHQRAMRDLERTRRGAFAVTAGGCFPTVVGRSERLAQALDQLALLKQTELPVLLVGPSGAGRRHLARAFAGLVTGRPGDTPTIDAAIVPAPLLAETLTQSIRSAQGQVLVLANAEHVPLTLASALIAQQQEGRLGARLVVTLDEDDEGSAARAWREALCTGRVRVAGLNERPEDIPLLIEVFAESVGLSEDQLSDAMRMALLGHAWPGHCAELRATLATLATRCGEGPALLDHLSSVDGVDPLLARGLDLGYHDAIKGFRRDLLRHALERTQGNRTRAAEMLGVQRTYFMRLIRELGADDIPPAA